MFEKSYKQINPNYFGKGIKELSEEYEEKLKTVSYNTWMIRPAEEYKQFLKEERHKFWHRVIFPKKDFVIKDPISSFNGFILILNHILTLIVIMFIISYYAR